MAGSETLRLRALTAADIDGGLALSGAAGWNQTAADWALFIEGGHAIGFRTPDERLAATTATMAYGGGMAWISMVLVDPAWRHRGLASLLVEATLEHLQARHLTPVLDATPAGEPVYRHLGFRAGFTLDRWRGTATARAAPAASPLGVRSGGIDDLDAMARLDEAANRVGRRSLLQSFLLRTDTRAWMLGDGSGFLLRRGGRLAVQIGPVVARDTAGALALLDAALAASAGPVLLDVPTRWTAVAQWLEAAGFIRQRPYVRMVLGAPAMPACGDSVFVLAGPEYG